MEAVNIFVNMLEAQNKVKVITTGHMAIETRLWQTVANMVRLWFSYMLMLAVMTFNVGLLWATILGIVFGYWSFGFSEIKFDLITDGQIRSSEYEKN